MNIVLYDNCGDGDGIDWLIIGWWILGISVWFLKYIDVGLNVRVVVLRGWSIVRFVIDRCIIINKKLSLIILCCVEIWWE